MKYKHFPALFFKHFIQPTPPINAKLKSLHGVLKGQLPHNMVPSHCGLPPFENFKIPPSYMVPHPICSSMPDSKPDHQVIQCPTANFGPILSGTITYPILIAVFDTYSIRRLLRALA